MEDLRYCRQAYICMYVGLYFRNFLEREFKACRDLYGGEPKCSKQYKVEKCDPCKSPPPLDPYTGACYTKEKNRTEGCYKEWVKRNRTFMWSVIHHFEHEILVQTVRTILLTKH